MRPALLSFDVSLRSSREHLTALLLALALAAGLLGGGNGLPASVIARALEGSAPLRAAALGLYFLLALPAARAALLASDAFYLRSLPVSRAALLLGQAGVLGLAEAPLSLLVMAGPGGPAALAVRGLSTLGVLLAAHALALDAPLAGLALVVAASGHPALASLAALLSPLLLWRAFGLAPAVPRAERRSPAHFSLAGALARVLARSRSEALVRAGLLLVLTCALSRLAALQQPAHLRAIACTGAWWWCALALGPPCAALEEAHTRERWSLLFAPAGAFVRAKLSLLLPAAALGGLLSGAAAGLTLAPFGGLAGLCAGGAVAASERDLERRGAAPGARVTRRVLLLLAGTLLAWSFE